MLVITDDERLAPFAREYDRRVAGVVSGAGDYRPGIVLDRLNGLLREHGLFFPIDPSTASRATLGGMAGNNSCGARSVRYGNTVHNVRAIDAVMAR